MNRLFYLVRAERLELSHLAALDPKSSVSTNSTTPANSGCKYTSYLQFAKHKTSFFHIFDKIFKTNGANKNIPSRRERQTDSGTR